MGAGCFIMAEFLNIPYLEVMIAGVVPGLLYFIGVSAGIWVEAGRYGIGKLPENLMPKLKEVFGFRQLITFFAPVGLLMVLLFMHYPAQKAAGLALLVCMGNYLLIGGPLNPSAIWERVKTIWEEGYLRTVITALAWLIGYLLERFDVQIPIIAQRPPNGQTLSEIKGKASTGVKFANEDFTFCREDPLDKLEATPASRHILRRDYARQTVRSDFG